MSWCKSIVLTLGCLGGVGTAAWAGSSFLPASFPFFRSSAEKPEDALSMGIVDINRIKSESKVFQKFKEMFDARNAAIHEEILTLETTLGAKYEHLKKQEEATGQTPDLAKQKAELDKEVAELEKMVRSRREERDEDYTKILTAIKQALKTIMDDLGKAHGLKIILNKSLGEGSQMDQSIVLFCGEGLDLTQEVIARLDKQMTLLKERKK